MKLSIVILLILISNNMFAQTKLDSLEAMLPQKEGTDKVDLLNEISFEYSFESPQKGIEYGQKALYEAKANNYPKGKASALHSIGVNYWVLGKLNKALLFYLDALKIYEKIGDKKGVGAQLGNIAIIYHNIGDFEKAIEHNEKALKIAIEINDTEGEIISKLHIGNVYFALKDTEKALKFFHLALDLANKHNINNIKEVAISNIGSCMYKLERYEEAISYFEKSRQISIKLSHKDGMLGTALELGVLYIKMNNYPKALTALLEAEKLAEEMSSLYYLKAVYNNLSIYYRETNDLKKALKYLDKYIVANDSMYNETSFQQIADMQTKYETEKKEQENVLLRKDNQIQTNIRNSFIGFSALILLMILILFNRFRLKKKAHKKLLDKNIIISNQRDKLKESNSTKDKFFSIISHDLKSPFSSIMGFSDILYSDYDSYDDSERKIFISKIKSSSKSAYSLLDNLLVWARSQTGGIKINKETLNLNKLVLESIEPYRLNATSKKIDIIIKVPEEISLFIDKNTSMTFIGNIVNNAIKFTPNGGSITIESKDDEDTVHLHFIDNGVGMTQDAIDKLFRIDKNISTPGTNKEKGTGLGLILCKEFIEKNGGTISVKSKIGKGTVFITTFSKHNDS